MYQFVFIHPTIEAITPSSDGKTYNYLHSQNRLTENYLTFDEFFHFCHMLPKETISNLPAKKESFITGTFKIGNETVVKIHIDKKADNYHQFKVRIINPNLLKWDDIGKENDKSNNHIFILKTDTEDKIFISIYQKHQNSGFDIKHPSKRFLKGLKDIAPKSMHDLIESATMDPKYIKKKQKDEPTTLSEITQKYGGHFHIYTTNDSNSKYSIEYNNERVHSIVWISNAFKSLFESAKINCIELDGSFDAIYPYVYCVFNIIINNESIPMGISLGPSEKFELYSNIFDVIQKTPEFSQYFHIIQSTPILSDEGAALKSLCKNYNFIHFFCFRHIIEKFGSKSRLGLIVRNLLYSSYSPELFQEKFEKSIYAICAALHSANEKTINQFNKLFNAHYDQKTNSFQKNPDFVEQSLYSRARFGVPTTTNHSESLHQKLNAETKTMRQPIEMFERIIQHILEKQDLFPTHRNFDEAIKKIKEKSKHKTGECGLHCEAKRNYFASLYGVPHFPCPHDIANDFPIPSTPSITRNDYHSVIVESYSGSWAFKTIRSSEELPEIPFCSPNEWDLFNLFCLPQNINFREFFKNNILKYKGISDEEIIIKLPEYYSHFCCHVYGFYHENALSDFVTYFQSTANHTETLHKLAEQHQDQRREVFVKYANEKNKMFVTEEIISPVQNQNTPAIRNKGFNKDHFIQIPSRKFSFAQILEIPKNPITVDLDLQVLQQLTSQIYKGNLLELISNIGKDNTNDQHLLHHISLNIYLFENMDTDLINQFSPQAKTLLTIGFFTALKVSSQNHPRIYENLERIITFFQHIKNFPSSSSEEAYLCIVNLSVSLALKTKSKDDIVDHEIHERLLECYNAESDQIKMIFPHEKHNIALGMLFICIYL